MQAVTLKDAQKNLPQLVDRVLADAQPQIITSPTGKQVVMMTLDEYESWKQTAYLLSNAANAARLQRSIEDANRIQTRELGLHRGAIKTSDDFDEPLTWQ